MSTGADDQNSVSPRAGRLIILSAPSGAGKTSLARALIEDTPSAVLSISHTTRPPRPGELHGKDYFFVDRETFVSMIDDDAFLEHAEVFGNFYGTSRAEADAKLAAGFDVILDIDWQGARMVRERVTGAFSVFILPPSLESLRQRLDRRGQDSDQVIDARMHKALAEMSHYNEYDRVIINADFQTALGELKNLVAGGEAGRNPANSSVDALVFIEENVKLKT